MKHIFLILGVVFMASCAHQSNYQAKSVDEARAYAKRAVETGVVHAGGEQALFLRKSEGKPATGTWKPEKIEKFVHNWVEENPERARINLAATSKAISENERVRLTMILDMNEEAAAIAERQQKAAALQAAAASLNSASAAMNQAAADRSLQAERLRATNSYYTSSYSTPTYTAPKPIISQPTYQKVDLHPTYGGGYRGTITTY